MSGPRVQRISATALGRLYERARQAYESGGANSPEYHRENQLYERAYAVYDEDTGRGARPYAEVRSAQERAERDTEFNARRRAAESRSISALGSSGDAAGERDAAVGRATRGLARATLNPQAAADMALVRFPERRPATVVPRRDATLEEQANPRALRPQPRAATLAGHLEREGADMRPGQVVERRSRITDEVQGRDWVPTDTTPGRDEHNAVDVRRRGVMLRRVAEGARADDPELAERLNWAAGTIEAASSLSEAAAPVRSFAGGAYDAATLGLPYAAVRTELVDRGGDIAEAEEIAGDWSDMDRRRPTAAGDVEPGMLSYIAGTLPHLLATGPAEALALGRMARAAGAARLAKTFLTGAPAGATTRMARNAIEGSLAFGTIDAARAVGESREPITPAVLGTVLGAPLGAAGGEVLHGAGRALAAAGRGAQRALEPVTSARYSLAPPGESPRPTIEAVRRETAALPRRLTEHPAPAVTRETASLRAMGERGRAAAQQTATAARRSVVTQFAQEIENLRARRAESAAAVMNEEPGATSKLLGDFDARLTAAANLRAAKAQLPPSLRDQAELVYRQALRGSPALAAAPLQDGGDDGDDDFPKLLAAAGLGWALVHLRRERLGGTAQQWAKSMRERFGSVANPHVRAAAARYRARAIQEGLSLEQVDPAPPREIDPRFHEAVARAYHAAESRPDDPEVRAAYKQFTAEVSRQFEALLDAGIEVVPVHADPYPNSAAMMRDVARNRRLKVFVGASQHDLLTPEENVMFRAVHDFFGHAQHGHQFGPVGEEGAYRTHAAMFSALARRALATETRGQNSWVNFGPFARRSPRDRPFARQKAALLPESLTQLDYPPPGALPAPRQRESERGSVDLGGARRQKELEARYGTDRALGVRFRDLTDDTTYGNIDEVPEGRDIESLLPDEGSASKCTDCAAFIVAQEGRGRVVGYADGENPTERATGGSPGNGHDFAIIDERYIVDPWVRETAGTSRRAVFDLRSARDRSEVRRLYGDPRTWQELRELRKGALADGIDHIQQLASGPQRAGRTRLLAAAGAAAGAAAAEDDDTRGIAAAAAVGLGVPQIGSRRFHSRVARAISEAKLTKAIGEQWHAYLSKQPMPREEFELTIEPFLRENWSRPLTKAQVEEAMRDRSLRFEGEVYGEHGDRYEKQREFTEAQEEYRSLRRSLVNALRDASPDEPYHHSPSDIDDLLESPSEYAALSATLQARPRVLAQLEEARVAFERQRAAYDAQEAARNSERPRHESHTEPGGSDYREDVVRVEGLDRIDGKTRFMARHRRSEILEEALVDLRENHLDREATPNFEELEALMRRHYPARAAEYDALARAADTPKTHVPFTQTSHFPDEDPVFYVRSKRRRGPNGAKVVHGEEFQSDAHQTARKSGYRGESDEAVVQRRDLLVKQIKEIDARSAEAGRPRSPSRRIKLMARLAAELERLHRPNADGEPVAVPFAKAGKRTNIRMYESATGYPEESRRIEWIEEDSNGDYVHARPDHVEKTKELIALGGRAGSREIEVSHVRVGDYSIYENFDTYTGQTSYEVRKTSPRGRGDRLAEQLINGTGAEPVKIDNTDERYVAMRDTYDEALAAARGDAEEGARPSGDDARPSVKMPLKKTLDWLGAAWRTLVDRALREDADYVTWSPGEVHAERWNLGKAVKRLEFIPEPGNKDGGGTLVAFDHTGAERKRERINKIGDLDDWVGEDVADRLLDTEARAPEAPKADEPEPDADEAPEPTHEWIDNDGWIDPDYNDVGDGSEYIDETREVLVVPGTNPRDSRNNRAGAIGWVERRTYNQIPDPDYERNQIPDADYERNQIPDEDWEPGRGETEEDRPLIDDPDDEPPLIDDPDDEPPMIYDTESDPDTDIEHWWGEVDGNREEFRNERGAREWVEEQLADAAIDNEEPFLVVGGDKTKRLPPPPDLRPRHVLEGDDLVIGKNWPYVTYDQMMHTAVAKWAKMRKIKATVEEVPVEIEEHSGRSALQVQVPGGGMGYTTPGIHLTPEIKAQLRSEPSVELYGGLGVDPIQGIAAYRQLSPSSRAAIKWMAAGYVAGSFAERDDAKRTKVDRNLRATERAAYAVAGLIALRGVWRSGAARALRGGLSRRALQNPAVREVMQRVKPEALLTPEAREAFAAWREGNWSDAADVEDLARRAEHTGPVGNRSISDLVEGEDFERGSLDPETAERVAALAVEIADAYRPARHRMVETGLLGAEAFSRYGDEYLRRLQTAKMRLPGAKDVAAPPPRGGGSVPRLSRRHRRLDLTPEERDALGEMRESSLRLREGMATDLRDLRSLQLFKDLGTEVHPEWRSASNDYIVAAQQFTEAFEKRRGLRGAARTKATADVKAAYQLRRHARRALDQARLRFKDLRGEYVALPDTPGLGPLRGAPVKREVHALLTAYGETDQSLWQKFMNQWRRTMTVRNLPATHIANTASNVAMAHVRGLYLPAIVRGWGDAWADYRDFGPITKALAAAGFIHQQSTITGETFSGGLTRKGVRKLAATTRPETARALAERGINPPGKVETALRTVDEQLGYWYEGEDAVFRVLGYKHAKAQGMSDAEALDWVQATFGDFRRVRESAPIQLARNVVPFITYPAVMLPRFVNAVLDNPIRWLTLMAIPATVDMYAAATVGRPADEDMADARVGTPRAGYVLPTSVQLPAKGAKGERYFLNPVRFTPASAAAGAGAPGTAGASIFGEGRLGAGFEPTGPPFSLAARAAGRDPYTGEKTLQPFEEFAGSTGGNLLKTGAAVVGDLAVPSVLRIHATRVARDLLNRDYSAAAVDALGFVGARPTVVRPGQFAARVERQERDAVSRAAYVYGRDIRAAQRNPERVRQLEQERSAVIDAIHAEAQRRIRAGRQ